MRVLNPKRRSISMQRSTRMRVARIARIKQEIERGDYETPEKLACAVDRFLEIEHSDRVWLEPVLDAPE